MARQKDLYEALCRNYEFMLGPIPNREEFKSALRQTITEDDIRIIFLLPFRGELTMAELERRAAKAGLSREQVHDAVRRLVPEGFIASFVRPVGEKGGATGYPAPPPLRDLSQPGRVVMRGDALTLTEMQVRKHEHDPMRLASAHYMNAMIEGRGVSLPTHTPYFRVLPAEAALCEQPAYGRVTVDAPVPDTREVLPFDVVSEMVKRQAIVALAECYCRRTKIINGEGCDHPLETCLYFNDLARLQIESGRARQIDTDEALRVLALSEEAGLVHNAHNTQGQINALCNCCTCSCGVLKAIQRGERYAGGPARFVAVHDAEKCVRCQICVETCPVGALSMRDMAIHLDEARCIGCGLCVTRCPEGALSMRLREHPPKVYKDMRALMGQISREAMVGLLKQKLAGRRPRGGAPSTK